MSVFCSVDLFVGMALHCSRWMAAYLCRQWVGFFARLTCAMIPVCQRRPAGGQTDVSAWPPVYVRVCVCVIINVNFYTAHYFLITALRNLSCTIFASSAANQPAGQPL